MRAAIWRSRACSSSSPLSLIVLLLSYSMEEQYADVPVVGLLLDEFRTQASARADAADIQVLAHSHHTAACSWQ